MYGNEHTVVFDDTKNQPFSINKGFKNLARKLKANGMRVETEKTQVSSEVLKHVSVFVIACPRMKYTAEEVSRRIFLNSIHGNRDKIFVIRVECKVLFSVKTL